ncbi:MAG: methyltransferase domain-containing protein [Clostridia bacterium]|nr:methyltransferase domain-containing protein [Clostridia bacterium]
MNFESYFKCPICKGDFSRAGNSLKCEKGHSFDIASSGYINLLKPGKMNNAKAGDSKEMIRARSNFFLSNAYLPIRKKICEIVGRFKNNLIIDAGCGEGYYTEDIAEHFPKSDVIGFDMSKFGCEHGAKSARRVAKDNILYSVSSIFEMPLSSSCADIVINMFAPVASEEFLRVLKTQGHVIVVSSGAKHLDGLKSVLYDDVYDNEEKFPNYDGFELLCIENLKYDTIICGSDTIYNLFTMTPYYHRTSTQDKEKLQNISSLETTVEVNFAIYRKL